MKKIIILLMFISSFYICVSNVLAYSLAVPEDAIRIRIVANSNSKYDQKIKGKVRDKLQMSLYNLLKDTKSSKEARLIIKNNLDNVNNDVKDILLKENYNKNYNINFGYNYFPAKKYNGIKYKAGYYESLLVTLGEGKGDNWWCVLFPPLCLIEGKEEDKVEYKSFAKEVINKYFK